MSSKRIFYKEHKGDKIWQIDSPDDEIGKVEISFDKKAVYNLWTDYGKLTAEQKAILKEEMPFWYKFFERRDN